VRRKPRAAGHLARPAILLATLCLLAATAGSAAARTSSSPGGRAVKSDQTELASSHRTARVIPSASMRALPLRAPVVAMAATPSGRGAWRVGADGGVFTSGDAKYYGSTGHRHLNQPIVGMAATPNGHGYWFVARDGGIFAFGNAHYYGSTGGKHLNQPIVGMVRTRSGHGYWLIARDGGVFSFGDAHFYGSTGSMRLNQPIVGGAAAPSGHGYWFVAADGGVFSFGSARFKGSVGGSHLSQQVVGMAADQGGYLLLTANGRVFSFGGARNYGSATNACPGAPAVAIATSPETRGYWIAFANARAYALSPKAKAPHCTAAQHKHITTKTSAAAIDLFNRLNDERRARGLAPLQWDGTLASYASHWSKVMGQSADLHHSNIGDLLGPYDYVGENIAMGSRGVSAGALHNNWMHSQDHRDNILSPGFQRVGVGVYCASDGSIWATQEFGRPSSSGPPPPYSANTPQSPVARPESDNLGC
jgi:uncharacterized protein YkwD/ribosomal protein L24E